MQYGTQGIGHIWVLLCFLVTSMGTLNAQSIQGGDITRQADSAVYRLTVNSSNAQLKAQAQQAFQLHGAYQLTAQEAAFDFNFEPAGGNAILLVIESRGQELFRQTVTGNTVDEALMQAADLAVLKTTGQPGFFGGKLAFVSQRSGHREIYVSDVLFRQPRQLTNAQSNAILPAWSPDGSKLLYTGYHLSGFPDIFMIEMDTGRRSLYAGYKGTNSGAVFSPDGRQVAMILSSTGNPELYVGRTDNATRPRRLTNNAPYVESSPTWSPDGQFIVMTSDRLGGPQIYRIPASGGAMRRVPTNISGYCTEPDWNPRDPNQLVFSAATGGATQLAIYDFDTGKNYFLTSQGGDCAQPAWCNDGRHVVYTRKEGSQHALWIIDTVTGTDKRLSPSVFGDATQADFAY